MIKGEHYIGVGVGALILKEGKILVGKRGFKARDDIGLWDFPGGGLDFGETFEEGIRREVLEEFGIEIKNLKFLRLVEAVEEGKHWIGPSFVCEWASGEAKPLEEDKFSDFKWATLEELSKLKLTLAGKQNFEYYMDVWRKE